VLADFLALGEGGWDVVLFTRSLDHLTGLSGAVEHAHRLLAPEQGRGEALPNAAIVDLATLGRKRGQCLPAGQLITERGFAPIEHVAVGDRVLTHMGRFRPVTRGMHRHYPWPLLSIRSAGIFMPTVAIADHPLLVHCTHNDGAGTRVVQEREWLPACELVPGSRLTKDAVRTFVRRANDWTASTRCSANSSWPTDSKTPAGTAAFLLARGGHESCTYSRQVSEAPA
jgi:hypothetical protein